MAKINVEALGREIQGTEAVFEVSRVPNIGEDVYFEFLDNDEAYKVMRVIHLLGNVDDIDANVIIRIE